MQYEAWACGANVEAMNGVRSRRLAAPQYRSGISLVPSMVVVVVPAIADGEGFTLDLSRLVKLTLWMICAGRRRPSSSDLDATD